jgi:hypothetical protein
VRKQHLEVNSRDESARYTVEQVGGYQEISFQRRWRSQTVRLSIGPECTSSVPDYPSSTKSACHTNDSIMRKTLAWGAIMLLGIAGVADVNAGPIAYGICQTGCNAVAVACYATAGAVFGTVTVGVGTLPAILGCNAGLGACMARLDACRHRSWETARRKSWQAPPPSKTDAPACLTGSLTWITSPSRCGMKECSGAQDNEPVTTSERIRPPRPDASLKTLCTRDDKRLRWSKNEK